MVVRGGEIGPGDRSSALGVAQRAGDETPTAGAKALIEYVCLAKHGADRLDAKGYAVAMHERRWAYCARGAEVHHEWTRVPPTPLDEVTTGKMEERPPAPRRS